MTNVSNEIKIQVRIEMKEHEVKFLKTMKAEREAEAETYSLLTSPIMKGIVEAGAARLEGRIEALEEEIKFLQELQG
jgi:4-hydroxy-L-threonine phosphate dehydrogenase PdxA